MLTAWAPESGGGVPNAAWRRLTLTSTLPSVGSPGQDAAGAAPPPPRPYPSSEPKPNMLVFVFVQNV